MSPKHERFFGRVYATTMILCVAISPQSAYAGGSDCRTGPTVKICVEWGQGGNPTHLTDYTVDFSDSSNPDVELMTADLDWIVHSELVSTGAAANIGALNSSGDTHFISECPAR